MITSFICASLLFLLPLVFWGKLRAEVPLFYSLPWGEQQIVQKPFLFALGGISILFITLNIFLTRILDKDTLVKRILWLGCALANILALITLIRIISLF